MRTVAFTSLAFKEYNEWFELDKSIIDRIKILIREIDNDPFKGIGNHAYALNRMEVLT